MSKASGSNAEPLGNKTVVQYMAMRDARDRGVWGAGGKLMPTQPKIPPPEYLLQQNRHTSSTPSQSSSESRAPSHFGSESNSRNSATRSHDAASILVEEMVGKEDSLFSPDQESDSDCDTSQALPQLQSIDISSEEERQPSAAHPEGAPEPSKSTARPHAAEQWDPAPSSAKPSAAKLWAPAPKSAKPSTARQWAPAPSITKPSTARQWAQAPSIAKPSAAFCAPQPHNVFVDPRSVAVRLPTPKDAWTCLGARALKRTFRASYPALPPQTTVDPRNEAVKFPTPEDAATCMFKRAKMRET